MSPTFIRQHSYIASNKNFEFLVRHHKVSCLSSKSLDVPCGRYLFFLRNFSCGTSDMKRRLTFLRLVLLSSTRRIMQNLHCCGTTLSDSCAAKRFFFFFISFIRLMSRCLWHIAMPLRHNFFFAPGSPTCSMFRSFARHLDVYNP